MHKPNLTRWLAYLFTCVLLIPLLVACGGTNTQPTPTLAARPTDIADPNSTDVPQATEEPTAATTPSGDIKVLDAVFAKKLSENMEPAEPAADSAFTPKEQIAISLKIDGRPKQGEIEATFYWRDQKLDSGTVNLADANSGVLFSIGQSTFVGFTLSPTSLWPISEQYRVEVTVDGKPLDIYHYKVVAADGAPTAKIIDAVLAEGADDKFTPINPTSEFATDAQVFLVGSGDFAAGSWIEATWYIDGKLDAKGTRLLGPFVDDNTKTGFNFSFLPEKGWPEGKHEVVLTLNDQEVNRYSFTIGQSTNTTAGSDEASALQIGDLKSYTYKTGLFTISVPDGWQISESGTDTISVSWVAPEGNSGVFVGLRQAADTLNEAQLGDFGKTYVETVFGSEPKFETQAPVTQDDGSVLVAFRMTSKINDADVPLIGLTYIEQRGDKVSALTVLFPVLNSKNLWSDHFEKIVNSYKIDQTVSIRNCSHLSYSCGILLAW